MDDRLYFRQLLCGRDIASGDQLASQMVNFVYLIGDRVTGEAVVVDPAYDVDGIIAAAGVDDMKITGALVTHYHPDHCGGSMMGHHIQGAKELLERISVPIHAQADEVEWIEKVTELTTPDLVAHQSGDVVEVGEISIELIHTPGHTPGSQCFFVEDRLVAGDTLFLQGCGRTDLPGGDPAELYRSLTTRLSKVPDTATLFPGHLYSPEPSAPMGATRADNVVFKASSEDQFLQMFGGR